MRHLSRIILAVGTCVVLAVGVFGPKSVRAETGQIDSVLAHIQELIATGRNLIRTSWDRPTLDSGIIIMDSVRSLAVRHLGSRDTCVAVAQYYIGLCKFRLDDYAACDSLVSQAVNIWRENLGDDHPRAAGALRVLGDISLSRGDYVRTEQLYTAAQSLVEHAPDAYLRSKAILENNLGLLARRQGRLDLAAERIRTAMRIWMQIEGDSSYFVAVAHLNLGITSFTQREYDTAERWLTTGRQLLEQTVGPDHYWVSDCLGTLSDVYLHQGRYDDAARAIERAVQIREQGLGSEHGDLGMLLARLARIRLIQGDGAAAQILAERAVDQTKASLGDLNRFTTFALSILAEIHAANHQFDDCIETYGQLIDRRHRFIDNVFTFASEEQKLRYIETAPLIEHTFISFAVHNPYDPAIQSSLEMILRGKGAVVDAMATERGIAHCTDDPSLDALVENHRIACDNIAMEVMTSTRGGSELQGLFRVKDSLETELSYACSVVSELPSTRSFAPTDVAAALPDSSLLLEYVRYRDSRFDQWTSSDRSGESRYAAYSMSSDGAIALQDLGPASLIDSLIVEFESEMRDAAWQLFEEDEKILEDKLTVVTSRLYELLVAPLAHRLKGVTRLVVSPDGQLCLLPFGVLTNEQGQYLVENHEISYVSSGRDLMDESHDTARQPPEILVVAAPDFDLNTVAAGDSSIVAMIQPVDRRGRMQDRVECSLGPFQPLPATRVEAESVADLWSRNGGVTHVLVGRDATESLLKSWSEAPTVLHLATHGYYCGESDVGVGNNGVVNPLLSSGIAFAGANRSRDGRGKGIHPKDDGILTALEVSELNLNGTELVVLSACQSGTGAVMSGEGVFGLRRALRFAGARATVMSMFVIPDRSTVTLMDRFYTGWLSGESKVSALNEAARSIIHERRVETGAAHPLYWGGFVLVGDPR